MRTVAFEEHCLPSVVLKGLGTPLNPLYPDPVWSGKLIADLDDLGEGRLAAMDAAGIDMQVLMIAPPGFEHVSPVGRAHGLAATFNDALAEAGKAPPHRFADLAALASADPGGAAAEIDRAAELGLAGVLINNRTEDRFLD